jgi:pimeloyl-ACP methyl ester carboxylesterase
MRAIASVAALASRARLAPNPAFVRRTLRKSVFDPDAIPADDRERAVALACEPAAARAFLGVYAGALREIVNSRALAARLASWRGPTTLAWGRDDAFIPIRALAAAKAVYPQASALELERCGHCPAIEHPAVLAAHLRANGV